MMTWRERRILTHFVRAKKALKDGINIPSWYYASLLAGLQNHAKVLNDNKKTFYRTAIIVPGGLRPTETSYSYLWDSNIPKGANLAETKRQLRGHIPVMQGDKITGVDKVEQVTAAYRNFIKDQKQVSGCVVVMGDVWHNVIGGYQEYIDFEQYVQKRTINPK